ncbi:MAG: N-acetylmuramoyl-L-alanine amidase [Rhodospirillales bacterium]|jgi:N-acetylmuramoyl-L-alanine amidase|nr:N-acetylmuramoyl-L-alanine amidase [Rhodospirillales bacterium]
MSPQSFLARRLLLTRIGTCLGVFGTFLLPGSFGEAQAASRRSWHRGLWQPPPFPRSQDGQPPLVMIDPGHGGRDPGAIGVSGTYEKNIALAAAHDLYHLLQTGRRYRVAMTRHTDVFIPLEQRVELAQRHGAALFVSMHADALVHDPHVRGASVYTFASHASDPQSAVIAESENSSDRYVHRSYQGLPPQVARILASLMRRETRALSGTLAERMVGSLTHVTPMLVNPERHAGFVVLQSARIPSVLVEMGFMSSPLDEAALRRPGHRQAVATAMRQAVDGYFASRSHLMAG